MNVLKLNASGNRLSTDFSDNTLISKNANYDHCEFEFDSEWENLSKTAVFWQNENQAYHILLNSDGMCAVPKEVLQNAGITCIGVFGTDENGLVLNTNPVYMRVLEGCLKDGITPPEPTPDIYAQVMAVIKGLTDGKISFENGKSAYELALDNGFEGTEAEWLESLKGEALSPTTATIELFNDAWDDNKQQSVTVSGISENSIVLVSPAPTYENIENYTKYNVLCVDQTENTLVFSCETLPLETLVIYVKAVIL